MTSTPVRAHEFDSRDPAAIHGFLSATYDPKLRIHSRKGYRLTHQRVDAGPFAIATTRQTGHLGIGANMLAGLVIARSRTARVDRACAGSADRLGPGEVFLVTRPGEPSSLRWYPGTVELCVLDLSVLAQVAVTAPARRPGSIRFTGLRPATTALARQWRDTVTFVNDVVLNSPAAGAQPLVIGNAARMLAAAALTVFPSTAFTEPTPADRRDATAVTLRRAITFLEDHADRDISAVDIAGAAGVSLRSVQLAFRRHLGTTPMAYLRRLRLVRAHHDLVRADPQRETVSAIASRWGFASHSRFTAWYHASYGVPPRETLHT
ncbi:helix-turn-helix transcriptional regulator [Micromonospora sp. WMMD1120]|uniref:helix-turn-helix transcriptional regulator n=1 Tax=Micromonospora sp. WMMD1120 TaxID=3016106 RepID=UPI002416808D|nr:helix-turn-helix transcriptional regulator [Micromonospora sp. WMMD1120]MDG4809667.1 helix-turn-helix transcriptional regulator [Micromonospora sp. WMMD1120]